MRLIPWGFMQTRQEKPWTGDGTTSSKTHAHSLSSTSQSLFAGTQLVNGQSALPFQNGLCAPRDEAVCQQLCWGAGAGDQQGCASGSMCPSLHAKGQRLVVLLFPPAPFIPQTPGVCVLNPHLLPDWVPGAVRGMAGVLAGQGCVTPVWVYS